MSGLADRFSTVAKAKISRLLDRAEDPGEALDYAYERQLEALGAIKGSLIEVVAAKKRLQAQEAALGETARKLSERAREVMGDGDDGLARAALERKQLIMVEIESLEAQLAELEAERRRLAAAEARLGAKVRAFRTRKEALKAQYSVAQAEVAITGAANGVGEELIDATLAARRAIDKSDQMRARAEAVEELEAAPDTATAVPPTAAEIDRQLTQLGVKKAVDEEFAKLKAELAKDG